MKYTFLISQMTWSYSRLTCFEKCPYAFLLTYIIPQEKEPQFFASYGSFIHDIFARFFTKKLEKWRLPSYYIQNFQVQVEGKPPSEKVFANFLNQGYEAMLRVEPVPSQYEVLGVEKHVEFDIDGIQMTGYIDLLIKTPDGIHIVDHKSHILKKRSGRKKKTASDTELDSYLRQLYLYSIAVEQIYGERPKYLSFYCYRSGELITERFSEDAYEAAKQWVKQTVAKIADEDSWNPKFDYYCCNHLCDVHSSCEYHSLYK